MDDLNLGDLFNEIIDTVPEPEEWTNRRELAVAHIEGAWEAYKAGKYTDLTIKCRERTFQVHKLTACTRSEVFGAMIDGDFREGKSSHIDLPDDNPGIIESVIEFLYRCDYALPDAGTLQAMDMRVLRFHAEMYAAGDKYNVFGLCDLAKQRYGARTRGSASRKEFLLSIEPVYFLTTESDRGLRDIAAKYMYTHGDQMSASMPEEEAKDTEKIVKGVPDFAWDVLSLYMKNSQPPMGY